MLDADTIWSPSLTRTKCPVHVRRDGEWALLGRKENDDKTSIGPSFFSPSLLTIAAGLEDKSCGCRLTSLIWGVQATR
jgi:hypothetical protein